jgi:hypothetical protein
MVWATNNASNFSLECPVQGCQIFLDTQYQNGGKYTKWPLNYQMAIKGIYQMAAIYSYGHRIYKPFIFLGPPKFTQIGIFGFKIHLPSGNPALDVSGPCGLRTEEAYFFSLNGQHTHAHIQFVSDKSE